MTMPVAMTPMQTEFDLILLPHCGKTNLLPKSLLPFVPLLVLIVTIMTTTMTFNMVLAVSWK